MNLSRPKRPWSPFIPLLAALFLPPALPAQDHHGALRGVVEDSRGALVPGAKVLVHAVDSSVQREAITDDHGQFRLEDLPPSTYHVVVKANGFAIA
jgi:protocatechuate 3,4-dioxygenase beta subunit